MTPSVLELPVIQCPYASSNRRHKAAKYLIVHQEGFFVFPFVFVSKWGFR